MKIRTKLKLNTILIVIFALVNCIILSFSALKASQLLRVNELSSKVTKDVFDLNLLAYEYFHYGSRRSYEQWQAKHEAIDSSLKDIQFSRPDEQETFVRVERQLTGINNLMEQIFAMRSNMAGVSSTKHLEHRLVNNVLASSQTIIADVYRLEMSIHRNLKSLSKNVLAITLAFSVCYAVVVVFFSMRMRRTIVDSVTVLEDAVEIVGSGDLEHRITSITPDEIGHVASEFNKMTDRLQHTYGALARECSERIKAELFNRNIMDNIGEGLIVVNRDHQIILANRAFLIQTGKELDNVIGHTCYEVTHSANIVCHELELECLVKRVFETGEPLSSIHEHCDGDGRNFTVEAKAYPLRNDQNEVIAVIEIINDITEKLQNERQLRQSQKMEAIGTLASGIAHDFNNMLTPMLGYTELALIKMGEKESVIAGYIENVSQAAMRARDLVRQILTFSRQGEQQQSIVRLDSILKEALKLIRSSLPSTIEIRQVIECKSLVLADPTQIHQVIMNLCTNAYHAMEQGGVLGVVLQEADFPEGEKTLGESKASGRFVALEISDTGCGMTQEIIDKIFEPFFTTKETGKGTGIGLSVVDGIVKSHGGWITVYSEPGVGSTFRVYLPACKDDVRESDSASTKDIVRGNNELIMYVDDEERIRHMAVEYLAEFGYRVETFANGEEALSELSKRPGEFALMISDMTMPLMNGKELVHKVRMLCPNLPIILCTGYSVLATSSDIKELGVQDYIQKPASILYMVRSIHRVLLNKSAGCTDINGC